MEENKKQYLSLLSEIIAKESVILGPDITILKARSIAGLVLDSKGNVINIKGDTVQTLKNLIDVYVGLSGQATKNAIDPIFAKYPQIHPV